MVGNLFNIPRGGFEPPRQHFISVCMPTSTECEADALPPSHHSWMLRDLVLVSKKYKTKKLLVSLLVRGMLTV